MTITRNGGSALALLLRRSCSPFGMHTPTPSPTAQRSLSAEARSAPASTRRHTQTYAFGSTAVITTDTAEGLATCNFSGGSSDPDGIATRRRNPRRDLFRW